MSLLKWQLSSSLEVMRIIWQPVLSGYQMSIQLGKHFKGFHDVINVHILPLSSAGLRKYGVGQFVRAVS